MTWTPIIKVLSVFQSHEVVISCGWVHEQNNFCSHIHEWKILRWYSHEQNVGNGPSRKLKINCSRIYEQNICNDCIRMMSKLQLQTYWVAEANNSEHGDSVARCYKYCL
jgi:hypothetical protein